MRFSIIIPVYRVEEFLEKCVDSVLKQEFKDYEIVLINDGSPDNCGKICDEYANRYENVRALHKENGGLSDARNYGLQYVQGEYVIFLDSDDWIAEGCLKVFDEIIGRDYPDVVETTLIEAYEEKNEIRDREFEEYLIKPFTKERAIRWNCCISHNTWPAPKKIYALSFLKKNNLRFLSGRLHEDVDWTSRVMYCAEVYKGCTYPWYYHRMGRVGSITNSVNAKNITDVIEMAAIHYKYYQKNPDVIHAMIFKRIMASVYASMNLTKKCSEVDKIKVVECISKNRDIFRIAPALRHKIFFLAMRILGISRAIRILNLI